MTPAIILNPERAPGNQLEEKLRRLCPYLQLRKYQETDQRAFFRDEDAAPALVFWNPEYTPAWLAGFLNRHVVICVTNTLSHFEEATRQRVIGYLLEPLDDQKLTNAVETALQERDTKQFIQETMQRRKEARLVGIPTMDGTEVMPADEIIRCEARVRCTIIVTRKGNIISAYNIGEFRKMLCPIGGFFATHRAHIVNLNYVRRLNKSRTVEMHDGHEVPITQENKVRFLEMINSLR